MGMDKIWEKIHESSTWGGYPPEHVIRFVARNYYSHNRKQVKILDFGCGQGANTWYLAREGFDTYAFDGSDSAIKKCEEKLKREGLVANLQVSDGSLVNYPDDSFDAVIDNACIYANEVKNIEKMYRNIFSMLKSGGKLLTACFGKELGGYNTGVEIESGTYKDIKEGVLANRGVSHIYTEEELKSILRNIGFTIEQCDWIRYIDRVNMVHQIICVAKKA